MEQILPWQNMVEVISRFTPRLMAKAAAISAGNHAASFTACSIGTT
jgi:hypothetical protein